MLLLQEPVKSEIEASTGVDTLSSASIVVSHFFPMKKRIN